MSNPRWLRLKALHERVFELPLEEARAIVSSELADDPELAQELISLLEQKKEETSFLAFDDAPQKPSIFPPHHRLGDYELLHEIGRGGMGFVYMARHLPLERDVALKVLNPTLSFRQDAVDRFRREAQRLAKFKNPGIVPIFDVQSIDSVHFFAMEYVDGLDLHRELVCLKKQVDGDSCRTTLPDADSKGYFRVIADIVRQAATALADAHDHQITHRDIKPHNLILGRDGRVRIVDFGIARDESMGRTQERDEASGTLYYMSPEQARLTRDRVVDHRTDIYSLGVVLYELLTLRRPFEGATQRDVLKAIEARDAKSVREINPRVPRDLAVICQTAMEKEPAERYSSARAFAEDLERFLASEAILAMPPTNVDLMRRWTRKHRLPLSAAALTLVALGVGYLLRDHFLVDPRMSHVSFAYTGPSGELAPTRLSYQSFDPVAERFGEIKLLGNAPFRATDLPGGFVRFRVEYGDGQVKELFPLVRPGARDHQVLLPTRAAAPPSNEGMVLIRGGTLRRRIDPENTLCSNLGQDIEVQSFQLDTHEVTVRQYREFLEATGHPAPELWDSYGTDPKYERRPMVDVSIRDMQAFAEHHGKRLPTHAEWEWAARGAEDRRTPNGEPVTPDLRAAIHGQDPSQNMDAKERLELWKLHTRDVGTSADDVTPEGVYDMLANAREAVESAFVNVLAEGGVPQVIPDAGLLMGAAWYTDPTSAALETHTMDEAAGSSNAENGFRCARSVTP